MKKALFIASLLWLAIAPALAQRSLKNLRTGQLPSGLTYYIYATDYTPEEAHFYLVQNVGGIVEDDKQQGIAHFLEHLAFNATTHFPEGVMNFFLRRGINSFDAKTGLNETRYQINSIPTRDSSLMDSALLILRDWCDGILIRPEDVDKERQIVTEEWRSRSTLDTRLSEAIAPSIYNDAKYAHRNVIGRESLIKSYTAKDIRRFYEAWYRPSLQCVMVIGDIDVEAMERKLMDTFASMPRPKHSPTRPPIVIAPNSSPRYYAFVDADNSSPSFGLYQRIDAPTDPQQRDYVASNLYSMLFNDLAPRLFARLRNDGQEASIATTVSYNPLVRLYDQCAWDVVPYAGREQEALRQTLAMRERLRRVGFEREDFEERRRAIVQDLNNMLAQSNLEAPNNMMDLFRQNYLYGVALKPIKEQVQETLERLLEMELEDLNGWLKSWLTDSNLAFITYSSKPHELRLSLSDLSAMLEEVKTAPTLNFDEPKRIDKLIDFAIKSGTIVAQRSLPELDDTREWTLSNGAKFYYKYIPQMKGQFYFVASSYGGRSVVPSKSIPSFTAMQSLIMRSGLHHYSRNDLHAWLKDRSIELNINIDKYSEGLGGNAPSREVTDFFDYLYLVLMRQRFDRSTFDKYVSQQRYLQLNTHKSPRDLVQDSIQTLLFPPSADNPRQDATFYDAMRYEDLLPLFEERLVSARDFNYCLVGDIPEDMAKALACKYIASLPSGSLRERESYKLLDYSASDATIVREFVADLPGEVGELELSYDYAQALSAKEQLLLPVLETYLQNKLFEELREREQGTYTIGVNTAYEEIPAPSAQLSIRFSTSRDKVKPLTQKLHRILDDLAAGKIDLDDFRKSTIPHRLPQGEETQADDNPMLWLALINAFVETGKLPAKGNSELEEQLWAELQAKDLATLYSKLITGKKREITLKSLPTSTALKHVY